MALYTIKHKDEIYKDLEDRFRMLLMNDEIDNTKEKGGYMDLY
jgi:hypothetical protein